MAPACWYAFEEIDLAHEDGLGALLRRLVGPKTLPYVFVDERAVARFGEIRTLAGSGDFDVATGYFEIAALLALDGQWQNIDKLRILIGDEVATVSGPCVAVSRIVVSTLVHHLYTTEGWYGRVHSGTAMVKSAYLYVFVDYDERQ